jgi:hypothetical protein
MVVAGNVVRDLASLDRMEMLPWDVWGIMSLSDAGLSEDERTLLDLPIHPGAEAHPPT